MASSSPGECPDVRPYVAHATAAVAPMRIARGIQNKVLEAMSMGKPVVLTSGALEGIEARPGAEVILADDGETFAAGCCRMALRRRRSNRRCRPHTNSQRL